MNPVQFEVALACRAAGKLQHGLDLSLIIAALGGVIRANRKFE